VESPHYLTAFVQVAVCIRGNNILGLKMHKKSDSQPCIAVDVMGGDVGPSALIPGALEAARKKNIYLIFVGKRKEIEFELDKHNLSDLEIEIVHADEVADMRDKPSHISRRKKNSSIQVACDLVKEERADGLVSAGHTGVTMACGIFTLGRIKGIERPGLAAFLPREENPLVLMDVGANVDVKPRQLVQFAMMADVLAQDVLKIELPRVAILSIGEEQGKGNIQVNEAYKMLNKTELNFMGNVEGRDLFEDSVDVAICDGFVGNVALKLSEGLGSAFVKMLKQEFKKGFLPRLGSLLSISAFKRFGRRLDHEEYGGAPLLGLNGTIMVCHGSARSKAISKAVMTTAAFISSKTNRDIKHRLELNPEISRFHRLRDMLTPGHKSNYEGEYEKLED
jgi:glycerol-3-phosphate acyltransferase PlsX